MRRPLLLLICLSLAGCGFRQAMQRGQAAADQQDWAGATTAYEAALREDPDDERAIQRLAEARRRWHAQALARFEKALADGDLLEAKGAVAEAEAARPDEPSTAIARARLQTARHARQAAALRADAEKAEPRGAYRLHAKAERLHSTPEGAAALDAVRARLIDDANAAESAGQFRASVGLWQVLASVEPDRHGAPAETARGRWADAVRARSTEAESRGAVGPAFVFAAQAAALSASPADATRRDTLRGDVLAGLALVTSVEGSAGVRMRAPIHALQSAAPSPDAPKLALTLEPTPAVCTQSKKTRVLSDRYVASTRVVTNPRWRTARQDVRRLRDRLRQAESEENDARERVWRAERRFAEARRRQQEKWDRQRREAEARLARARSAESRAYDQLRDAQRQGDRSAISRCESDVQRARRDVDGAWRTVRGIGVGANLSARGDLQRARRNREHLQESVQRARERLDDAERRLDGLSPTEEQPVYATHRYPVHDWTRSCTGQARLVVRAATGAPVTHPLSAIARTRDSAHLAQVPLQLNQDPLQFSKTDAALKAEVQDRLGRAAAALARAAQRQWALTLAQRAQAEADPAEQARLAAATVLLSREDVPPALTKLLAERFDVADFGVLLAEGPR